MKRFTVALVLLLLVLPGCGTGENSRASARKTVYASDTPAGDCCLCGDGLENLVPFWQGQNNVALVSLNTFTVKPVEINRYDRASGEMIEEYAGFWSFGGGGSRDGEFSASMLVDHDRGYADVTLNFYGDAELDVQKAAAFLCADCLNALLPQDLERCFGVGVVHLGTREARVLDEPTAGFILGDFYLDCDLKAPEGREPWMRMAVFYCPERYREAE